MKLPVVANPAQDAPWYADGLKFTCTQCGNCCTGGPGYVWITREEITRLAEFLGLSPAETVEQYCRKVDGKFTLDEKRGPGGSYDCIFLTEYREIVPAPDGSGQVSQVRRGCAIYPVRPLQCRTWPFWPENLTSKTVWDNAGKRCHGINAGRHFTPDEIRTIRDAPDWPDRPPTSATRDEDGR